MPLKTTNSKKSMHFCFSISLRDGNGIDLGSKFHSSIVSFFRSKGSQSVLSIEKYQGHNDRKSHYQGGIFFDSLIRQDNLKRTLVTLWESCYGNMTTDQKKHAICVKPHKDWEILRNYCMKEVIPIHPDIYPTGINLVLRSDVGVDYYYEYYNQKYYDDIINSIKRRFPSKLIVD